MSSTGTGRTLSGMVIDVIMDNTSGTLSFDIDGTRVNALNGFPAGAKLRPFIMLFRPNDQAETS